MGSRLGGKQPTGFGVMLRERRSGQGLTQQELADRAGCSVRTVCQLEQDRLEPGWRTVINLAKALGVTPDAFLPPADPPAPATRPRGRPKKSPTPTSPPASTRAP